MNKMLCTVFLASCILAAWPSPAVAEDGKVFPNTTSAVQDTRQAAPEGEPAVKPKKPLTSFIKDYAKEYEPKVEEEEEPIVEKQDALRGASYDEKEYYNGKTDTGYKKVKEDFVNPHSVMTK